MKITKMNATDCHAPWQTETDWYMVGAGGDGCEYKVVQGWKAVVAEMCRQFIGGVTIQYAIDRLWDELSAHLEALADPDEWIHRDNGPDSRPHVYSYSGECFEFVVYLLTEPPPATASLCYDDAAVLDILIAGYRASLESSGRDPAKSPTLPRAEQIRDLLRRGAP